ncbi:MAG TPA: hypothetical protein ENH94_03130 [Phycisphaerales bacterium]|nr:hypothetical protein [Phycisphaerales bacterium]
MAHAEKCPLCNGTGNEDGHGGIADGTVPTCHGCRGSGWVSVQDANHWPGDMHRPMHMPVFPDEGIPIESTWKQIFPPPSFTSSPYSNSYTAVM